MDEKLNDVDIRVNSKINFYGPVVMIGSVSISGVGLLFLGVWMITHWAETIILSAFIVYGVLGLVGLAMFGLVVALWVRFVARPFAAVRAQAFRNRLIHAGENAIVLVQADGVIEMVPLKKEVYNYRAALPSPEKETEPQVDESTILELYDKGLSLRSICESTGLSYYAVQRICAEAKRHDC